MKFSPTLAMWLSLGAVFLGLLTTFLSLWAGQRKKAADRQQQLGTAAPGQDSLPPQEEKPN